MSAESQHIGGGQFRGASVPEKQQSATINVQKRSRMQSLVVTRGVAALLVVLHHAGAIAAQPRFYGYDAYDGLLIRFTGINFFFILSGFFIGWINWKRIGQPNQATEFFVRRMGRIFPSYWLILFPLIFLYAIFPEGGTDAKRDPVNVIFSIFLLPYPGEQPVYGVAWTLVHEFLFAIVFSIILLAGKRGQLIFPIWAAMIVIANIFFAPMIYPLDFLLSGINLQFLIGVGAALLIKNRTIPLPQLIFSAGVVAYLSWMLFGGGLKLSAFPEQVIYALSSALVIIGLVGIERQRPLDFSRGVSIFGEASYSLYLIHPIMLSLSIHILVRLPYGRSLSAELVVIILSTVAVIAALVFDRFVENPLGAWVRRRIDRRFAAA